MSTVPVSDFTAHLGFWLRFVSNHVSQEFARRLDAKGVTVSEWVVLRQLYDGPATPPSQLAEALGMTRGAITKLAERLVAKQLVVREASTEDGRAHYLALTTEGATIVPDLAAVADINDAECFEHLTLEERSALKRILKTVVERRNLKTVPVE